MQLRIYINTTLNLILIVTINNSITHNSKVEPNMNEILNIQLDLMFEYKNTGR